ncbi:hypothetical protein U9M48_044013 [Paspalum notatum var. saurae]|uniref:GAG-pre-integrase domain-containing protein n=1 Tax=Paspalum notatum var. saurae TaxID=547442 RepID=A0AAQ3XHX5_PASNO
MAVVVEAEAMTLGILIPLICGKGNHSAVDCWHRFDETYQQQSKTARSATTVYGIDTNWYADSGATDHITSEFKTSTMDGIRCTRQVVQQYWSFNFTYPNSKIAPKKYSSCSYCPKKKNLASVHRLVSDNNVLLEFHPNFFLIKDRATKKVLHQGSCQGGLYPLEPQGEGHSKQVLGVNKPSTSRWHSRLGHPSFQIVKHVLRNNSLPCSSDENIESVYDSCQLAKSHQLPYPKSISVSITWIYLLKKKFDVFHAFKNFQNLVERKFNRKIITMQTDWGSNYERLNCFFQKVGIVHHVSCPHAHQKKRDLPSANTITLWK